MSNVWVIDLYAVEDGTQVGMDRPIPSSNIRWQTQPTASNPITAGDTFQVNVETWGTYTDPSTGEDWVANAYWGLHVAAVAASDVPNLDLSWWRSMQRQAGTDGDMNNVLINITLDSNSPPLPLDPLGHLMVTGQYASSGSPYNYCTDATFSTQSLTRGTGSGSTVPTIINSWTFKYNPDANAPSDWALVFAFGDPHVGSTNA